MYDVGDYVFILNSAMAPSKCLNSVGRVLKILGGRSNDYITYKIKTDACMFSYWAKEIRPATELEILAARLTGEI